MIGLLNGNWGIMVTYLEEILTDDNKDKGFANFNMMYALGIVLGPFLGLCVCVCVCVCVWLCAYYIFCFVGLFVC